MNVLNRVLMPHPPTMIVMSAESVANGSTLSDRLTRVVGHCQPAVSDNAEVAC